jgi:ribosomal-protein-alanine N-acetyltransferase
MVEEVRTERLTLRPLTAAERTAYVRAVETSMDHLRPWLPTPPPGDTAEAAFERELGRAEADRTSGTGSRWVALLPDGRVAGMFNLSQIFRLSFQNAYAGWWVAADCVGRGLATEGVAALLDLAFAAEPVGLGLHRVQANIIPRNAPSVRVAEKCGMRLEGTARRYLRIAGRWQDHLMFAKTAEEHAARYLRPG